MMHIGLTIPRLSDLALVCDTPRTHVTCTDPVSGERRATRVAEDPDSEVHLTETVCWRSVCGLYLATCRDALSRACDLRRFRCLIDRRTTQVAEDLDSEAHLTETCLLDKAGSIGYCERDRVSTRMRWRRCTARSAIEHVRSTLRRVPDFIHPGRISPLALADYLGALAGFTGWTQNADDAIMAGELIYEPPRIVTSARGGMHARTRRLTARPPETREASGRMTPRVAPPAHDRRGRLLRSAARPRR